MYLPGPLHNVAFVIVVPVVIAATVAFILLARRVRSQASSESVERSAAKRLGILTLGLTVLWCALTLWYTAVISPYEKDATADYVSTLMWSLLGGAPAHIAAAVAVIRVVRIRGGLTRAPDAPPTLWARVTGLARVTRETVQVNTPLRIMTKVILVAVTTALSVAFFAICLPQYAVERVVPSLGQANFLYVYAGGIIGLLFGGISSTVSLARSRKVATPYVLGLAMVLAMAVLATVLLAMYTEGVLTDL